MRCRRGYFTSGGTEADNLAVKGMYWKRREADPVRRRILVSSIEHHAVEETCEWLQKTEGAVIDWIPVDSQGLVDPESVRELIAQNPADVALVTVMWANNEVGTVQPIQDIAAIASEYGIPMHTDAVQAFGAVPVNFRDSGVDTMAISGHKNWRSHGHWRAYRHASSAAHPRFCTGAGKSVPCVPAH